ncbi:MAG TPA: phospholipid scramblase-related protein [Cytophagaceae bacterium]|nr:phospholipid scramblase-related protein [Cytophagaceae bacterium]
MSSVLDQNVFFVKEHVGMFKASNSYDILNPETKEILMTCREENLGFFTKLFRFSDYKRMTPFDIEVKTTSGELIVRVKRGVSIFVSTVEVFDGNNMLIGKFKQKFFSIGGKFDVLDANEQVLCTLKGKWTSWDFKFATDTVEYATVTKKWAGLGKELFTTADNYVLSINDSAPKTGNLRKLILAAVMCIDMVLKE